MAKSKIFSKVPIEIPNRSGFNMSHSTSFTATCGTLIPALVEPLLPNTDISLDVLNCQVQFPPFASDFYGQVQAKLEAFFVPYRVLYGGWQDFITHDNKNGYPAAESENVKVKYLPRLSNIFHSDGSSIYLGTGAGSLADFLGHKSMETDVEVVFSNSLPFLAYHKIYEDFYLNWKMQKRLFRRFVPGESVANDVEFAPYITLPSDNPSEVLFANPYFNDGVSIFHLRQRNWRKDYFTNASLTPQQGESTSILAKLTDSFGLGTGFVGQDAVLSDNTGNPLLTVEYNEGDVPPQSPDVTRFTMSQLFAANAIENWKIRQNLVGNKYDDQIFGNFGIRPSSAVLDRSVYLGQRTFDVYTKGVLQTAPAQVQGDVSTSNLFGSVGSKYGSGQAIGQGSIVGNFKTTEHGFLFVMFSIVPEALYSSGTRRYLGASTMADFPFPLLSSVGDQEIRDWEIEHGSTDIDVNSGRTFGYTQRYSEYKYHHNEVHGKLRDDEEMESYQLQRSFYQYDAQLTSDFLEIPTDYLDQVYAVSQQGNYAWVNINFGFNNVNPLPEYSLPTLAPLKDVHTEYADLNGSYL